MAAAIGLARPHRQRVHDRAADADGNDPDKYLVVARSFQAHCAVPERAAFLLDDRRLYITFRSWHSRRHPLPRDRIHS
jgi:hypothetical protein